MFELIDMPMDWPVEVNYHEAKAFCAWKGPDYRLPTEAEHHVMRGSQVKSINSSTETSQLKCFKSGSSPRGTRVPESPSAESLIVVQLIN